LAISSKSLSFENERIVILAINSSYLRHYVHGCLFFNVRHIVGKASVSCPYSHNILILSLLE
jgi:hypothetical protein